MRSSLRLLAHSWSSYFQPIGRQYFFRLWLRVSMHIHTPVACQYHLDSSSRIWWFQLHSGQRFALAATGMYTYPEILRVGHGWKAAFQLPATFRTILVPRLRNAWVVVGSLAHRPVLGMRHPLHPRRYEDVAHVRPILTGMAGPHNSRT